MPRLTRIYTRKGDDGTTGLGGGQRVSKDTLRVATYGTVDEVNSHLGVVLAAGPDPRLATELQRIQNELFHLGSDLCFLEADTAAFALPQIESRHVEALERLMDDRTRSSGRSRTSSCRAGHPPPPRCTWRAPCAGAPSATPSPCRERRRSART
jgi:cob(I)alamin adenosyltransferase